MHLLGKIGKIRSRCISTKAGFLANGILSWTKLIFGPHWLAQPKIASLVAEAMHYRDGKAFNLYAYCVMSNHVHLVFRRSDSQPDLPLSKIMQSLKRQIARQANIILGRAGAFWQDESYDHVIRSTDEFLRIVHYVLQNPVKAGLASKWEEWPWTFCKKDLL